MVPRREFLKLGAVGAAAAATLVACGPRVGQEEGSAGQVVPGADGAFPLQEATVADLQGRMESGELSAQRITELYLERIQKLNHQGPELNAILVTNPDALAVAQELDRERSQGKVRGSLHGTPWERLFDDLVERSSGA